MSRYSNPITMPTEDPLVDIPLTVNYGTDHALGYWYDVIDAEGEMVEEKCSIFDGLTGEQLVQAVEKKWGVQMPHEHRVICGVCE